MAYAPTHEKELLDQSDRRRMGMHHKPHVPPPNKRGRPRLHTTREILDAVFSTFSRVAALGDFCLMSSRLGRPSTTTTSGGGESTEHLGEA
jgi:hypothetical protein